MKKLSKFLLGFLISFIIFVAIFNKSIFPLYTFGINLNDFKIVKYPKTVSVHVTAYGVPAETVEFYYTSIRSFLACSEINNHVTVYLVKPDFDRSIGSILGHKIYGAFRKSYTGREDIIIYNGNDEVLSHEMSHFFYSHMNNSERDEDFAQLVTRVAEYNIERLKLVDLVSKLYFIRSGSNHAAKVR